MVAGIEDVARHAGVSTATVSRALRGLPHVSEATRERVRAVAAELGYVASPSAASLATGRTRTVCVLTPYVARWFFAELIEAAETALRARGYDALLYTLPARPPLPRPQVEADVVRKRVDAVVVVSLSLSEDELEGLRRLGRPLCFIGSRVAEAASVRIDDGAAARTAVRHLLAAGHRRVAHIGGPPVEGLTFRTPMDRRDGWAAVLADAGLPAEPQLDELGHFTVEGGRAATARLLDLPEPPTAVFCSSDEMAIGAVAEARARGLDVPGDLSVVGIDDHPFAGLLGLTTVAQDVATQGRAAAELLLEALAGVPGWRRDVVLPTRLVERRSVAPPGVRPKARVVVP